jgi:hypothetical protein
MAKSLNTFAALLLAFPFYLAIKGKLASYIALAKPGQPTASGSAPATSMAPSSTSANTVAPAPTPASSAALSLNDVQGLMQGFNDTSSIFS